ncbi:MAG: hypothetical protein ACI8QC_004252 [Planctomycetota bacterium]|jgi:hypothetical protein
MVDLERPRGFIFAGITLLGLAAGILSGHD